MDLLCISKVSLLFYVFLIQLKRIYTRVLLTGQGRLRWLRCGVYVAAEVALTGLRSDSKRRDPHGLLDFKWRARIDPGVRTVRNARGDTCRWIENLRLRILLQFRPSEQTSRSWSSDRRSTVGIQ